jgi:hypothetical protein
MLRRLELVAGLLVLLVVHLLLAQELHLLLELVQRLELIFWCGIFPPCRVRSLPALILPLGSVRSSTFFCFFYCFITLFHLFYVFFR